MSKRNIRPNSGKQLYLNQIFYKGMLYTSSEMQEGFAKIIDNYDIAPTGDAASPRYPLIMQDVELGSDSTNIIPIQFKQDPKFSYIKFKRVISESEYVNDIINDRAPVDVQTHRPAKQIEIIRRDKQEFVDNDQVNLNNIGHTSYMLYEDIAQNDISQYDDTLINTYKNATETMPFLNYNSSNNNFFIKYNYYNGESITNINTFNSNLLTVIDGTVVTSSYIFNQNVLTPSDRLELRNCSQISSSDIKITDGDTFDITINNITNEYRLYGVDTPETTKTVEKWGPYATKILTNILKTTDMTSLVLLEKFVTIDVYGRMVSKFYIGYRIPVGEDNPHNLLLFKCVDISALLLHYGIGKLKYLTLPTGNEIYKNAANNAIEHSLKIYSDVDFDPYYEYPILNPNADMFLLSEKDNLQLTSSQYIEIVSLNDQYPISAKTNIRTKVLSAKYIDYLDSLAFIGRIIDTTNNLYNIAYKGIILLRCVLDSNNNPTYIIQLPSNQGEGVKPNIINATVSGGYNINNSNMINISNNTDQFKAFDIIGVAPLRTQNNELLEPYEIVTQAVAGQKILLKAMLNENGYYTYNNITTTDMFGFDVYINPIYITINYTDEQQQTVEEDFELYPATVVHREIGDYTNQTILSYNINTIKENILNATSLQRAAIFQELGIDSIGSVTWETIINTINTQRGEYLFTTSKVQINKNNTDTYIIQLQHQTQTYNYREITMFDNYQNVIPEYLFTGSVLEMLIGSYKSYNDNNGLVAIVVFNNFSTINMSFNGTQTATLRTNSLPLKFYQQWYTAAYNDTNYVPISESKLIYTKPANSNALSKTTEWNNYASTVIKPTDYYYNVGYTNAQFKYSIQPKIENKLSDSCPSVLENLLLTNTYQEMYQIIPLLQIGNTVETVSDKTLRQNMDFKNATRLDVFNRQICLYGPYTISNVLFFSQFEVFDYFPFPSHVIELDEPITTVYNYKDALVIMGKYNIYMLSGAASILECKLNKIYENLSTHLADINCLATSGNNMIFFNDGMGYVIVPNIYVDSSSNIKIYKLTEYISNFFYNPEEFIRLKFNYNIDSNLTYIMELQVYVENNNIVIAVNVEAYGSIEDNNNVQRKIVVWFVYDQNYKYWRTYSSTLFDDIKQIYICEPQLNNQFLVTYNGSNYIAYFKYLWGTEYADKNMTGETITKQSICTTINSGYLSVDTMNDKRFKDIILELDNIDSNAQLKMECNFFVDGTPVLLSDTDVLVIDKTTNDTNISTDYEFDDEHVADVHHIFKTDGTDDQQKLFGKLFKLDNTVYGITGRTHIRVPVFGKGRLPLFTLQITSDKFYEFINYSMIYKEKNINRRS